MSSKNHNNQQTGNQPESGKLESNGSAELAEQAATETTRSLFKTNALLQEYTRMANEQLRDGNQGEGTRELHEMLKATLLGMSVRTLIELDSSTSPEEKERRSEQAKRATEAPLKVKVRRLAVLAANLTEPASSHGDKTGQARSGHVVRTIAERIGEANGERGSNEHTVVVGGSVIERKKTLRRAAWASPARAITAILDGSRLPASGANAIWRAAADAIAGTTSDEDSNPLARLLQAAADHWGVGVAEGADATWWVTTREDVS